MPPILNAQSITKQFGATPLFREISFTVDDGARIGLIGPNGAGKSTLLNTIAGERVASAGSVTWQGTAINGASVQNIVYRGIGLVPQQNLVGRATIVMWSTDGSANWFLPWTWFTAARWNRIGGTF